MQNRERREVGRPQERVRARELPDTTYRLVQTGFDDGDLGVVRDKKTRHAANRRKGARDQHLKGKTLVDRWPIGWPSEVVFFSNHGGPVLRDVVIDRDVASHHPAEAFADREPKAVTQVSRDARRGKHDKYKV
jgi:hypothetical protein